ncbi:MAG: DNA-3-methyladenine glycosylase [Anaerolineae bacterium]|nr:DNA-3-methyladenine glycosylase [Anaerolineae bacterium]
MYPLAQHKLPRQFYARDTVLVARELLNKYLVRVAGGVTRVGRIVETEAYLGPHDLAAHSSKGWTPRTKVMFGPPGHAYIYLIYGMHHCTNIVTEPEGSGSAVLLRALEPVQNVDARTNGPGLLSKAMGIDRSLTGHDLLSDDFYLARPPACESFEVIATPRVGVAYAGEWAARPLRFYIAGSPFVSRK